MHSILISPSSFTRIVVSKFIVPRSLLVELPGYESFDGENQG